jgi:hypothetical protein
VNIIYLMGPYTQGDVEANVKRAIQAHAKLSELPNTFCFCPHLYHFAHKEVERPYWFWMGQDYLVIQMLDAFCTQRGHKLIGVRLCGESPGAEMESALLSGIGAHIYDYADFLMSSGKMKDGGEE